jgi:precorrin-6A/cobalt-precorrin-6A reductase
MILVLGGTAEARELATALAAQDVAVTTSLAGRVANPRRPEGAVRTGGFGGPEALARWLEEQRIAAVVDASHPFAEGISASAARACASAAVPLLRLERPGWHPGPGDRWHRVPTLADAATAIPDLGNRVLLTTGRQGLAAFAEGEAWFLIRCVDPPEPPLPRRCGVILDRGPYTLEGERRLLDAHAIDLLVTKDSGGDHTRPKLDAARERGLPVIVVDRPPRPADLPTVPTSAEAAAWARAHAG